MKLKIFKDYPTRTEVLANEFFDKNQKIRIIDIKQSYNNNGYLVISIFYKDKKSYRE